MAQRRSLPAAVKSKPKPAAGDGGSLRGDLRRFTMERLVNAAMECFSEQGFRATTVERIVELAGTTAPTFYRHFPSKDDLLTPLREHLAAIVCETLSGLDGEACRTREGVRGWFDKYVAMWSKTRHLCQAFWEGTDSDRDFAATVLPESIHTAMCLRQFFDRVPEPARRRTALRLALMINFMDRAACLIVAETNADVADDIANQFSDMLWQTMFEPFAHLSAPAPLAGNGSVANPVHHARGKSASQTAATKQLAGRR